jgi:hypothetical protein
VYKRKRVEFEERVRVMLRDRFMVEYKRVYNSTVEKYRRELQQLLDSDSLDGILELDRRIEEEFSTAITALNTTATPPFEYDSLDLVALKQPLTQERVFKLKDEFMSRVKRDMLRLVDDRLVKGGGGDITTTAYPSDIIAEESERLNYIVTTLLGHSEIEVDLREWFSGVLRDVLDETLVRRWFDAEFKYCVDDRRRLVEYGSIDEMSVRWRESIEVIECRLDELSTSTSLLSHDKLISLKRQLGIYAEQCYNEYKRQREAASIPPYVYILLLVLGFNEIMYILSMIISSPLSSLIMVMIMVIIVLLVRNRDNHVVRMLVRMDVVRDVVLGVGDVVRPVVVGVLDGLREMIVDYDKRKRKSE